MDKTIKNLSIDLIKPYWKNTKKGTNVDLVKESIQKYGYNSLIIVDSEYTIIAGHSRYKALKELGYDKIDVTVLNITPKEAQKYRIIDNKITESNEWDFDNLKIEIRELGDLGEMQPFFNDIDLESFISEDIGQGFTSVSDFDVEKSNTKLSEKFDSTHDSNNVKQNSQEIICPHCLESFSLRE